MYNSANYIKNMAALLCFYDYGRVFAFLGRTLAATLERRLGAVLKTLQRNVESSSAERS